MCSQYQLLFKNLDFKQHNAEKDALWWITITDKVTVSVLCGHKDDKTKTRTELREKFYFAGLAQTQLRIIAEIMEALFK